MKQAMKIIGNLDAIISGVSLCIIVFITVAGVIMRRVVGEPFAWLEEMQLFFFVWTVFLGGSVAFRTGGQVSIDLVAARLKPKARRILDVFCYVVTLVVLIWLAVGGAGLAASVTKRVTPYFNISYFYIDIAGAIGCVLMIIQYTVLVIRELFHPDKKEEGGEA